MNLAEVREKYPAYADVPDKVLAEKLHAKFYSHVPFYQFAEKIGYTAYDRNVGERVGRGNRPSGLDKAVEAARSFTEQNIVGPAEAVATGASRALVGGVGGGAASLLARATGGDPAEARAAVEPFVVKPQTPTGKAIVADVNKKIGTVAAPVAEAVADIDADIGNVAGPEAQDFVRKVGGTVSDILDVTPLAPVVSRGLTLAKQAAKPLKTTADTLIERARAGGLRIRPSDVDAREFAGEKGSLPGRAGEFVAGHDELARDFVVHNKPVFNSLNAEEIGLPKGSAMGPRELEAASAPHLKVYETLRKDLQPIPMDDEVRAAIMAVDRGSESLLPMPARVGELQQTLANQGVVTPGNLIDTISDLRRQGFKGVISENPDIADVGLAQLRLADSLEKQLDAMVARQKPSMVGAYQDARQGLAKIHTLEATNVAGEVNPAALNRLHKKTERRALTGAQAYTAEMNEAFPHVVTHIVPDARPIRTGGGDLLTNALKVVAAPVRLAARGAMGVSRGEAAVPQTGLGRALAEYYKGQIDEGRGALKLAPPAGTVGDLPSKGAMPPNQADRSLLGPGHDVAPGQEGFNFTEPTAVEATGAPFEGAPKVNTGPNRGAPHRGTQRILVDPPLKPGEVVTPAGSGPTPAPRGLALASGRDPIPPSSAPTRGTVLKRSVEKAKADADKLSLEGRMEVPEAKRKLDFKNLHLEGGPPEHLLPKGLDDLLEGRMGSRDWDPNKPERKSPNPKLRKGGDLALPEGQVMGLPAPVNVEWTPNDVVQWALQLDPTDKAALIRYMRGEK